MNRLDVTDLYRIFHPETIEYTFPNIEHMLGHEVNINKFKRIEIT